MLGVRVQLRVVLFWSFCLFVVILAAHCSLVHHATDTNYWAENAWLGSLFTNKVSNLSNLLFAVIQKFKKEEECNL